MSRAGIDVPKEKIHDFCWKQHIRKLVFFGFVLRDDIVAGSDVDVLVEFEPGHVPGLEFFAMEDALGKVLGRKVDLNTPRSLSRCYRDQALAEAGVQYVTPWPSGAEAPHARARARSGLHGAGQNKSRP